MEICDHSFSAAMTSATLTPAPSPSGNRLLVRFLIVATTLYLAWFFGYEQWLAHDGRLDALLCRQIAQGAAAVLRAAGFTASISTEHASLLLLNSNPAVVVGPPCNGLVLYALFSGFVVAFPGVWLRKLWYIPAGIVGIWVLNVLRVVALALNHEYAPGSLDFNHHYTFTFVVYAFIFGLWMLWAKKLADPRAVPANAIPAHG
jgi:exosortase family protein XrtF